MKTTIPYIPNLEQMTFEQLCDAMETRGRREYANHAPWAAFPYKPITIVDLAASDDCLFARFFVRGLGLRAEFEKTNQPVWQDSCVEVFIGDQNGEGYRNFEVNCIGTLLSAHQTGRGEHVEPISEADAEKIIRHTTVKGRHAKELDGVHEWMVAIGIPFKLLGYEVRPETMRANFYKCADASHYPHYLCWSNIDTPEPDFHRPEFFGTLILESPKMK